MASPSEPRAGRLRRILETAPVAPFRPWFNRWFSSLSEHIAEEGIVTRDAVRQVGDELHHNSSEHRAQMDDILQRRLDEQLNSVPGAMRESVERIVGDLRVEARGVAEVALATDRRLSRLEEAVTAVGDDAADRVARQVAELAGQLDALRAEWERHRSEGVRRYLAESRAWFDDGVDVDLVDGTARIAAVTDRIVERPFAHRALAALPSGSRLLDVGATGSTLALELATAGHLVTALDPRPYPLRHPNLEVVVDDVDAWAGPSVPCDAVLAIGAVEAVGLGGAADADVHAMARFREWLAPGGMLVLSVPIGRWSVDARRIYDAPHLGKLLAGWTVVDEQHFERVDATTWRRAEPAGLERGWRAPEPGRALFMLV